MLETVEVTVADEEEDTAAAISAFASSEGWSDGLPVIPPTPGRVAAMVAASGRSADEVIGVLAPKNGEASVEKIAVNAVMAGCKPEYFPAVLAAIEGLADPKYELYGTNTTTNPTAPLLIVNGPAREKLGINCSWGVLGPCYHANATIGRAVSLCMINVAGRIPGAVSKGTYKHPGAYTMCAGEYEEESPWEPLHVERGFRRDDSTVTVLSATGTTNINDIDSLVPEDLAKNLAQAMCTAASNNFLIFGLGEFGLMINPVHAKLLAQGFKTKAQLKEYFHEACRVPYEFFPEARLARRKERNHPMDQRGLWLTARPDQYLIFVAGGLGGYHSCHIPTFSDSYAVTRRINS